MAAQPTPTPPVRYAVVGLGHIAQVAVLPAFEHAEGCELAALVSGDEEKRRALSEKYRVDTAVGYDGYEDLLATGDVDAVYIATPNHLHHDQTVAAARHGVHVLCEKPMAPSERACRSMIDAADEHDVRLMIAYRLHFEEVNMEVAGKIRDGAIGRPRYFHSAFGQDVKKGDIRLNPLSEGGGPVFDMGVYCINAARYLFRDEPVGVTARSATLDPRNEGRFDDVPEMVSAVLEFPDERLASFTTSFGSADVDYYGVVGTEGEIRAEPSYSYVENLSWSLLQGGEVVERKTIPQRDQFAPELVHLARCIREDRRPEPDGLEGLADVRIVLGVHEAARSGRRVALEPVGQPERPDEELVMKKPGVEKPEEIKASSPSE